ncbi:MAG: hypothetical protein QOF81_1127 [Acidimicrobiaceae bacterium]|nr:hypothetical protein [Acidimicrobiaceae bacterium]
MNPLVNAVMESVAFVLLAKIGARQVGYRSWRGRRFPRAAAALSIVVAVPSVAQMLWPAIMHALDRQPNEVLHHAQIWRLLSAVFVQDGGAIGTIFNLVSLSVIAALAEWSWGWRRMLAIFLFAGVLLNAQAVAFNLGGAGSSGATYALGASLAGVLVLTGSPRSRLRALACPLFGAAMFALGDAHGLAILYGAVIGAVLHSYSASNGGANRRAGKMPPDVVERANREAFPPSALFLPSGGARSQAN